MTASSSAREGAPGSRARRWASVGKRSRGFIDERVNGRRRGEVDVAVEGSEAKKGFERVGVGVLSWSKECSLGNLRNIFLPRLWDVSKRGTC